MVLPLSTFPQLAVSAKILCLLMVVICGAVPSKVPSVRFFNVCANGYLEMYPNGTVTAKGNDDKKQFQNFSITSEGFDLYLLIQSIKVRRYLCFRPNGKLFGLKISKAKALSLPRCRFLEKMNMNNMYNTYQSVANDSWLIAFNGKGLQQGHRHVRPRCQDFLKRSDFSITDHNMQVAGGAAQPRPKHRVHSHRMRHDKTRILRKKLQESRA